MEKLSVITKYLNYYFKEFMEYVPNLIITILILVIGWWFIKLIAKRVKHFLVRKEVDEALSKFLISFLKVILRITLFLIAITQLGIQTSSFIAMLGAAGLAIGLALQGSLSNFAGGIIIILFRPFKIGDWIETQGISGSVTDINLFYSKLTTTGNQLAVIPNAQVSNGSIVNYSVLGKRQDVLPFRIGYGSDLKQAKEILLKLLQEQELLLKDPSPQVCVTSLGETYIELTAYFWANNSDFWARHYYTLEEAQMRFEAAGIAMPLPQRDIYIHQGDEKKK